MDATSFGVLLGVLVTALCALVRAWRRRSFDIGSTVLTFLAVFGILAGVELIRATFLGDRSALPTSWREYVTVAGVTAIGLSLQYLVKAVREAWLKPEHGTAVQGAGATVPSVPD